MRVFRAKPIRQWPFWLLVAGWVCANSPQVAVYAVLAWVSEAKTFAHQRDLAREVAHLLVGEKTEGRVAQALGRTQTNVDDRRTGKTAGTVPTATVVKKLDLATETTVVVRMTASRDDFGRSLAEVGTIRRERPPHAPPRIATS